MHMLHHISFSVSDLKRSAEFYDKALSPLGYRRVCETETFIGYGTEDGKDKFAIASKGQSVSAPSPGFHLAFSSSSYVTEPSHRPRQHQEHTKWTPERIIGWARSKGDVVGDFVQRLLDRKVHPEQGYRSVLGLIRLSDKYGNERLALACQKALRIESISYQTVKNMLKNQMEKMEPTDAELQRSFFDSFFNENVRGEGYYQ